MVSFIAEEIPESDFAFSYVPTDTTLFRFSALTFNAHRIHLDKEYAQNVEGLQGMETSVLLDAFQNILINKICR